ncbi:MAG: hypothetical protein ACJ786_36155 [Catenulispora sp.]|jgi:hypothetical protein
MTQEEWARSLLSKLGIKATTANVSALMAWMRAEGGNWNNTAHFNPLNTTQSMPGASSMNSVGVKAYTSWDQGFDATVKTLQNGHYGGILSAMKSGTAKEIVSAIVNSVWGTKTISLSGVKVTGKSGSADTSSDSGGGGILSWPADMIRFFSGTTDAVASSAEFFAAFFKPSTYIRIGAGFLGILFLTLGIITIGMSAVKEN